MKFNAKYSHDHDVFIKDLLLSIVRYETKQLMDETGKLIYLNAANDAVEVLYNYTGHTREGLLLAFDVAAKEFLTTIPWYKRFIYSKYIEYAYSHMVDVEASVYKRFVTGGEGEGWIDGKVAL